MDNLLYARIASGKLFLPPNLFITEPSPEVKYLGEHIYAKSLKDATIRGLHTEESLLSFMKQLEYWSDDKEKELEKVTKDIEETKVSLFKSHILPAKRNTLKNKLTKLKSGLSELLRTKNKYSNITSEYCAEMSKQRYLIKHSIIDLAGNVVVVGKNKLERAIALYNSSRVGEPEIRSLARSETWLSIYSISSTPFDGAVNRYSHEQRHLIAWTSLYQNVKKHEEAPTDAVLEDDDAMDGWLIVQRRNVGAARKKDDLIGNEKIKNADEVFVMVKNPIDFPDQEIEDVARLVDDMNDPMAKITKERKLAFLRKEGSVEEAKMPGTVEKLQMMKNVMQKG